MAVALKLFRARTWNSYVNIKAQMSGFMYMAPLLFALLLRSQRKYVGKSWIESLK